MMLPVFKSNHLILAVYISVIVRGQYEPYGANLALKKPATRSSTYDEGGFMFNASLGVDGKPSTSFYSDRTCSLTNSNQKSAWWEVNLNGFFFIKFIRIYQPYNAGYNRLKGSRMYVSVENNVWQQIYFNSIQPPAMFDVNVTLDKQISLIQLNNTELTSTTHEAFISICELEAYEVLACAPYAVQKGSFQVVKFGDSIQNFTYGAKLNLTCEEGYYISEDGVRVNEAESIVECMTTQKWSRYFKCSVTDCGQPQEIPDHSEVTITPGIAGKTTYNATLTIQCNEGYNYSLQAVEPLRCVGNGSWRGSLGNCNDVDECMVGDKPCNSNGHCINTHGDFNCQCHDGYTGKRCDTVIRCEEILQPNNSNIVINGGINNDTWTYNTTVSISCNEGYTLNGENLVRCISAKQWNGSIGYCAKIPDAMNSMQAGSAVAVTAGGAAAAVCVVVIGIIIGVILYRRKHGHRAKTDETTFDDLPSSSEKITHKERDIKENVIYSEPIERKDHVCSETEHVYKNTSESSEYCYSYQPQNIKDKHTIQLKDLSSFFLSRKLEPHMFEEEYNTLPQGLLKPHFTALLPENRKKNRYKNMYAYDDTRVQLEIWDSVTETDYINACYVNGFKDFRAYIASQGPTKDILNDFWRMIWQTKSSKIVMLTNLIEEEKHKCEQYWPDEGSIKFGFITIRLLQIERFSDFTIRTLELKKERFVKEKGKVEPHLVKQFHFTAWPDKGVPRYASSLVHFRQKVRNTRVRGSNEGPMVVHCSAGIGRTGTFLALDYLADEGEKLGYINVFRCVETLRKQRVKLVQTVEQYVFLHEALVEALSCITSAMSTSRFRVEYKKLLGIDAKTRKRRLDLQYEELPMYVAEAKDDVYANAKSVEHRGKNRYSNILPDQNHSPYLNIEVKGCKTYINAVFLPAYKDNDIFIITQTPLQDTKVDFWRMVYQFEVSSIVMLNTLKEMKDEERYWPENEESLEISPFHITLESKSVDEICVKYIFLLQYHGDRRKVRLSRATYWADNEPVPKSPTEMLKQIELIQSWQQETGNKPIIVHCMNGAERSGLFCVVAALLERTKIEQDVAVEQIIKQMRSRRPQVIPNVDQFKFCYDAVMAFLDLYEEYSNFTQL